MTTGDVHAERRQVYRIVGAHAFVMRIRITRMNSGASGLKSGSPAGSERARSW